MMTERKITTVAATLKNAINNGRSCTLLIGAGCSVSAGIPTAIEIINQVKDLKPEACEDEVRQQKKFTYGDWMELLGNDERHDMFARWIDKAKINWAHICIASLMAAGYVDRILTTNFDPLIVQACALFGEFPAVYDFAASQYLKPQLIPSKAVFYLHGQRTGFILKNTPSELREQTKYLRPIIDDALPRVWIVVGYSGVSDPVFEHLVSVDQFGQGLYWVGYKDREPAEHVRNQLLETTLKKNAFYIKDYDADSFFDALIKELKIYPPRLVSEPFSHFNDILRRVTPEEMFKDTREMIQKAIQQFERSTADIINGEQRGAISFIDEVAQLMNVGDYDGVIKLRPQYEAAPSAEGRDYLSRAYMMKGNKHAEEAKTSSTQDNGKLFALAAEQYEAALVVKPDAYEVLNNWGVLLHEQSKRQPDEATAILARSVEMYDGAVQIKPDYYEALLHRGIVLANLAVLQQGKEAEALSARSIKDFNAALEIKPNSHEALTEWGSALRKLAKAQPEQAEILLNQATQKYQDALKIKPDYVKALNAWGDVLLLQADAKEGDEQESLVEQAMNKFFEADTRRPGSSAYSLARYKALIGDDWGCRESLERAKRYNQLPPRAIIRREPRFDSVRGSDWFEKLLQSN